MSDDLPLFGVDPRSAPAEPPRAPSPIADWQVDLLRQALDAHGLMSTQERRQAIESAVGRTVTSLRSLTHDEGMQALSRLARPSSSGHSMSRSWDDREEDTWIDRL